MGDVFEVKDVVRNLDKVEVALIDQYKDSLRYQSLHNEPEVFNYKARLAAAMVERWGCVACEVDGEDSSGRQKMRLATADELVNRAVEVAELLVERFREKNWNTIMPTLESLYKK